MGSNPDIMRLDKFIASSTDHSRSDVKQLVKSQAILVNGQVVSDAGQKVDTHNDDICIHNQVLKPLALRYFMINKPVGCISATYSSDKQTVLDLVDEPNKHKLQLVGRLDKDTTGLLLMTDDGQWNHKITSPHRGCFKTYKVTLERPLSNELVDKFAHGLELDRENRLTLPAKLSIIDEYHADIAIQEGRYHQVKRMFAAVGNYVTALHRKQIGSLTLDEALAPGEYRPLTPEEVNLLA